jgi:hypothetical protein
MPSAGVFFKRGNFFCPQKEQVSRMDSWKVFTDIQDTELTAKTIYIIEKFFCSAKIAVLQVVRLEKELEHTST